MTFPLTIKTRIPAVMLHRALMACEHEYTMDFEGLEVHAEGIVKVFHFAFDNADDVQRFRGHIARYTAALAKPELANEAVPRLYAVN